MLVNRLMNKVLTIVDRKVGDFMISQVMYLFLIKPFMLKTVAGAIPSSVFNMSSLQNIDLSENDLSGKTLFWKYKIFPLCICAYEI